MTDSQYQILHHGAENDTNNLNRKFVSNKSKKNRFRVKFITFHPLYCLVS